MIRMSAHSNSEENNAVCVRVIHKAKGCKNPKQPRHGSESRTAQRTKSIKRLRAVHNDKCAIEPVHRFQNGSSVNGKR